MVIQLWSPDPLNCAGKGRTLWNTIKSWMNRSGVVQMIWSERVFS